MQRSCSLFRPAVLAVAVALATSGVEAETYQIDDTHSSTDFSIRHLVGRTKGRFAEFGGTIVYDPADPTAATFFGTIQVSSIDTDNERRNAHLLSRDFFDVGQYATITFASTKVTKTGDNTLDVAGRLTIHGITKEVVLPVEVLGTGTNPMSGKAQAGFATSLTVKCSEYGVNSWERFNAILGDDVEIDVAVEANAN